jgi:hypothetical protein
MIFEVGACGGVALLVLHSSLESKARHPPFHALLERSSMHSDCARNGYLGENAGVERLVHVQRLAKVTSETCNQWKVSIPKGVQS